MRRADGFLEVLRAYMEREHKSLRTVAREMGIDHVTLVLLRSGKSRPTLRVVDRAEAFFPAYTRDYLFPAQEETAHA